MNSIKREFDFDIVSMGEIVMDFYPAEEGDAGQTTDDIIQEPGGGNANAVVAAAKLGGKCAFLGKVGDDAYGIHLCQELIHNGVNTTGLRWDSNAPTTIVRLTRVEGESGGYRFRRELGADLRLRGEDLDMVLLRCARSLLISSLLLVAEPSRSAQFLAVHEARQQGALICFDVNHRPGLWESSKAALAQLDGIIAMTDILKVNQRELDLLTDTRDPAEGISRLLARGVQLVTVTLGAEGCAFGTQTRQGVITAFPVDAIDPLGCGDAFTAALVVKLLEQEKTLSTIGYEELEGSFRFANAAGALAATKRGTIRAMPTREEVDALLAM